MSIADQITRLNNAKAAIKQSLENKGVTVSDSALLDEYPALINSIPMEGGDPYYEDLYNLRTSNGTNMASMFARTSGELDLRRVDVSKVTDMQYMFDSSTASVNIDGWDTSNVTNMYYMFNYFTGSVDISKLDTSKVTNANYMFYYANTDNIILTGLSFPKCTSLDNMFSCAKGTTLDLSSWDISNITSLYSMFTSANYKKIDLTGWKTTNVTNMGSMFSTYNSPLVELIIPDWDMTKVTSSSSFFGYSADYIKNLKLIDLSRSNDATITKIALYLPTKTTTTFGTVLVPENTSQEAYDALIAKHWAPIGAAMTPAPTSIDIVAELDEIYPGKSTKVYVGAYEPWNADTSKVELVLASDSSIATMTEDNEVISTGVLGDIVLEARIIDTQEVVGTKTIPVTETDSYPNLIKFRVASTPSSSYTLITVNGSSKKLSNLTYDSITDIYSYDNDAPITSIKFEKDSKISELIKLNTSNVVSTKSMFTDCTSLTSLDASNWDTSNVTTMEYMFNECDLLTSLDVNNWNTSNVTNMNYIFRQCFNLITLDVSNWDTSNVTTMEYMFIDCQSLQSLDLSNWDTSKVTNMGSMFSGCNNLTSLDLSNFDTSNVTTIYYNMFLNCTALHTLHLDNCSNDTISKIINHYSFPTNAIEGVTRTIYCKEENAAGLTPPTNWVFSYVTEEEPEVPVEPPVEDIPLYVPGEFEYDTIVTEVEVMVDESHDDLSYMFFGCTNLVSVNTEDWDTSNVGNMTMMFQGCTSLTQLDLSNFNTAFVWSMSSMFQGCTSLTTLDLSNWETASIMMPNMDMDNMFGNCTSLHTLRLDNCSNDAISKIINSSYFPTKAISGVTRTIYCKESEAAGLTAPTNWVFSYIVEELPEVPEPEEEICGICDDPACEYPTKGDRARCPECRKPYRTSSSGCMTHTLHGFDGGDSGGVGDF